MTSPDSIASIFFQLFISTFYLHRRCLASSPVAEYTLNHLAEIGILCQAFPLHMAGQSAAFCWAPSHADLPIYEAAYAPAYEPDLWSETCNWLYTVTFTFLPSQYERNYTHTHTHTHTHTRLLKSVSGNSSC